MIEPEDVPQYLVQHIEKCFDSGYYGSHDTDAIARFLNLCVEAGVVSPPCWAVKHDNGVLFGIFGTETEAKLNSCGDDVVEHWRGYGR